MSAPVTDALDTAGAVADALAAHGWQDWYIALYHAALEQTGDVHAALALADAAHATQPDDRSRPAPDDTEAVFGSRAVQEGYLRTEDVALAELFEGGQPKGGQFAKGGGRVAAALKAAVAAAKGEHALAKKAHAGSVKGVVKAGKTLVKAEKPVARAAKKLDVAQGKLGKATAAHGAAQGKLQAAQDKAAGNKKGASAAQQRTVAARTVAVEKAQGKLDTVTAAHGEAQQAHAAATAAHGEAQQAHRQAVKGHSATGKALLKAEAKLGKAHAALSAHKDGAAAAQPAGKPKAAKPAAPKAEPAAAPAPKPKAAPAATPAAPLLNDAELAQHQQAGIMGEVHGLHQASGGAAVPIHAVRNAVAAKQGPAAAHAVFDENLRDLHRQGKVKLEAASDLRKLTGKQLDDSIPGVGETLTHVKPAAAPLPPGASPADPGGTPAGQQDAVPKPKAAATAAEKAKALSAKPGDMTRQPMPLPVENRPYKYDVTAQDRALGDPNIPTSQVDPGKLIATQDFVIGSKLSRIKGDLRSDAPILVVRHNGKDYIDEGHHRAIVALRNGTTVPAKVVEYGADKKLHPVAGHTAPAAPPAGRQDAVPKPKAAAPPPEHVAHVVSAVQQHGGAHNLANLVAVRQHLAGKGLTARGQQDAAIHAARQQGLVSGAAYEGRQGISPAEQAARIPGEHGSPDVGYLQLRDQGKAAVAAPAQGPAFPPDGQQRTRDFKGIAATEATMKAQAVELTAGEQRAVNKYFDPKLKGNHQVINGELRKTNVLSDATAKNLSALIDRTPPLAAPVTAYRGMQFKTPAARDKFLQGILAAGQGGKAVETRGFTSTSLNPKQAEQFAVGTVAALTGKADPNLAGKSLMVEVSVRHGVSMSAHLKDKGESEILLNHGARYRVRGVHEEKYPSGLTHHVLQLEQIP